MFQRKYAKVKHFNWLNEVEWLATANPSALFQHKYTEVCFWHRLGTGQTLS